MDGGNEVLQVLKEIRDETRATNMRLDQTNARLESLEGRTDFLERRLTAAFEKLTGEIGGLIQRITDTEMRLATEVVSLAALTREVHGILVRADLGKLTERVRTLEEQIPGRAK